MNNQQTQWMEMISKAAVDAVREYSMAQRMETQSVRPDFTTYKGSRKTTDVFAFLAKVEHNILQKDITDDQDKIRYFSKHLEGEAQIWWSRVFEGFVPDGTFEGVLFAFKETFLDANYEINVKKKFKNMSQSGSVASYVSEVRELMRQFPPNYSIEDLCRDFFLLGLKPNVQAQVRAQQPENVNMAMTIALEVGSVFSGSYNNSRPFRNFNNRYGSKSASNDLGPAPMEIDQVLTGNNTNKYATYKCYGCQKRGHIRADCPLKDQGQSN